ncbi:hypothetical protein MNEG_8122, partial [Monoraphidium neglectum]
MSVCWGAAPGEGGGGGSDGGGSGAVGERLLVACRSSCIWLLDARGRVLRQWDADAPWAAQQVVAVAFGPGGSLLLLTAARVVHWVQLGPEHGGGGGADVITSFSVKRHHGTVRCLVYDETTSTLLIAGDGGAAASTSASGGDAPAPPAGGGGAGGVLEAAGATLSAWRLGGREAKLRGSWGRPSRGPGWTAGLAGAALGACSLAPRPWRAALSPSGEHAALVTHEGG